MLQEGILRIGNSAFDGCDMLVGNLTIPNSVVEIGDRAFVECSGFTGDLVIPDSVTHIGDTAFSDCSGFNGKLYISSNITSIGVTVFQRCRNLRGELVIPENVSSIGDGAFTDCSSFTGDLRIPENIKTIDQNAFCGCYGFTGDLIIPENVVEIGPRAFQNCHNFSGKIVFPANIKRIHSRMIAGSNKIEEIYFYGNMGNTFAYIDSDAFEYVTATAYYPMNLDCSKLISSSYGGNIQWVPWNPEELPDEPDQEFSEKEFSLTNFAETCTVNKPVYITGQYKTNNPDTIEDELNSIKWVIEDNSFASIGEFKYLLSVDRTEATWYIEIIGKKEGSTTLFIDGTDTVGETYSILLQIKDNEGSEQPDGEYFEAYDDIELVNSWISDPGRWQLYKMLCIRSNFPHVNRIAVNDAKIGAMLEIAWVNMLFKGSDGWRNLLNSETSIENAEKILLGLMQEYDQEMMNTSAMKTAKNFWSIWNQVFRSGSTAAGISDGTVNLITENIDSAKFGEIMDEKGYQGIIDEVLPMIDDTTEKENVQTLLTDLQFSDSMAKGIGLMDVSLKAVDLTNFTLDQIYQYEVMLGASETEIEMMAYLRDNCEYKVVSQAAGNLYRKATQSVEEAVDEIVASTSVEAGVIVGEEALNEMIDRVWFLKAANEGKELAVNLANQWFHTEETSDLKDSMRIVAFAGSTLGLWTQDNMNKFMNCEDITEKYEIARTLQYSLKMLINARELGEELFCKLEKYVNDPAGLEQSKMILKSMEGADETFWNGKGIEANISLQFSCPVSIQILKDGAVVAEIPADQEVNSQTEDVRYECFYIPSTDEYVKTVILPKNEQYSVKVEGKDMGMVTYRTMEINEDGLGMYNTIDNIQVKAGSVLETNNESDYKTLYVDYEGNHENTQEISMDNDTATYHPVTALSTDTDSYTIGIGEKAQLEFSIVPANATCQTVEFCSTNPNVAEVSSDGVVTGIAEGETQITAVSYDGDFEITYNVYVGSAKKGDLNADGSVTVSDLLMCLHHISGSSLLEGNALTAGDINGNGSVDVTDLLSILHYISGKIDVL